ncbi:MAG: DNA-binding domain-containing protein, partial [Rhodoferax sp.]|nr:DNA-binding domain-containing protein [Rhodoferax sp.]
MTTLAQQQQALLAFLFDRPNGAAAQRLGKVADMAWLRGLQVYQANGHALARSALRAAYPVIAQMLGEPSFDALAVALWHAKPPTRGDVSQWGGSLAEFLQTHDSLTDAPYLADVALVEWALHRLASAADGDVDAGSFALLSEHVPTEL